MAESARPGGRVTRIRAVVHGRVQGVGFRWSTRGKLDDLGLDGTATNLPDGTVEVTAQGDAELIDDLVAWLRGPFTPGRVDRVEVSSTTPPDGG